MKLIQTFIFLLVISFYGKSNTQLVSTIENGGTGSLREAVDLAIDGDTIRFNADLIANGTDTIVLTSEIAFTKGLVFKGLYNSTDTLYISGNYTNRIFNANLLTALVKNLTLDSMALINGFTIRFDAGFGSGGAIFFKDGNHLFIENCLMKNNESFIYGGAIYCSDFFKVHINRSSIINNNSVHGGGGIYSVASNPLSETVINNSVISENTGSHGGGIYAAPKIKINDSEVSKNTSYPESGGGIYCAPLNTKSLVTLINSKIDSNISFNSGGGIYSESGNFESTINVKNCSITNNSAPESFFNGHGGGGGIYSISRSSISTITVDSSTISKNSCGVASGGGIRSHSVHSISRVEINNSVFNQNSSLNLAGGVYSASFYYYSDVTINNSLIANNNSVRDGGGVYSNTRILSGQSPSILKINNSIISDNSALSGFWSANGGGIYSQKIEIDNSSLINNDCSGDGGGIFTSHSLRLNNCIIDNNKSHSGNGGGIAALSSSEIEIINSTLSNNSSDKNGGAIHSKSFVPSSSITIVNSTISNNVANDKSGAIYSFCNDSISSISILNSTIHNNLATADSTAIYSLARDTSSIINVKGSIISANGTSSFYSSSKNGTIENINSQGFNIFSNEPAGYIPSDSVNVSADRLNLLPLANNGGETKTMLPAPGSIAINNGDPSDLTAPQNRPLPIGTRDRGAAEVNCSVHKEDVIFDCNLNSYQWRDGNTYITSNTSEIYTIPGAANGGCDSVYTLNAAINSAGNSEFDYELNEICGNAENHIPKIFGESGGVFTSDLELDIDPSSGIIDVQSSLPRDYNIQYKTISQCPDSSTFNLRIKKSDTSIDTQSACGKFDWIDGNTYAISNNTATHTLTNNLGCDSIIILNLTIDYTLDKSITRSDIEITANEMDAEYQWVDCDNFYTPILGETNKSFAPLKNGSYAVILKNNCFTDTSVCKSINSIGIDESVQMNIKIQPNPSNGNVILTLPAFTGVNRIEIYNSLGQQIKKWETNEIINHFTIDSEKGVYYLKVTSGTAQKVLPLVIH